MRGRARDLLMRKLEARSPLEILPKRPHKIKGPQMDSKSALLDKMRPCVKASLNDGARDKSEFAKMRFAIIFELNRLHLEKAEIKMALLEWDKKSFQALTPGDATRKLSDFVNWFFKHECKMSCKTLVDYCLFPDGGCTFGTTPFAGNISLPFTISEAIAFLDREYQPHGYIMGLMLKILFKVQQQKNARAIVFVGLRTLQAMLNNEYRHNLDLMTISRALNMLEEAKFISIKRGQSGTFGTRHANGYTFLPWSNNNP